MSLDKGRGLSPLAADMRVHDPDRYLATLFAPAECRDALFALYAFDHEIAKVRRLVREPMAGLIRLQWWRDALDGIQAGNGPAHPVAAGLSEAITRHGLDRAFLDAAIDARERELEEAPPAMLAEFEQHLTAANGGIAEAAVTILGSDDPRILSIAVRMGLSLGLLEKLRGLEAARDGVPLWLPETLLAEHGLSGRDDHGDAWQRKIGGLQNALAAGAKEHLSKARMEQGLISRRLLSAFFPGTLADVRLRDVRRSEQHPTIAMAAYRLCWHWLRGRF